MEKVVILGEEINSESFPILVKHAKADLAWTEKTIKSVADAWHGGNVMSAMQALESDLQHG